MDYIVGNHEVVLRGPHGERARSASHVRSELIDYLKSVPLRLELEIEGKSLLMTHGSPWPPYDEYMSPAPAAQSDAGVGGGLCHTRTYPCSDGFERWVGRSRLIRDLLATHAIHATLV